MNRNHKSLLLSSLGGLLLSFSSLAFGQTSLAVVIANDAGGRPPEDYQDYADSLAVTLKMLSPAQLEEVFKGGAPSLAVSGEEGEGPGVEVGSGADNGSESGTGIGTGSGTENGTESGTGNNSGTGSENSGDTGEVNLSPEYEAALDNLLEAQSNVNLAQAALNAAIALLEEVLKDPDGLIVDDILGNFLAGVVDARENVATARKNLASAREAEIKAKNEFDQL